MKIVTSLVILLITKSPMEDSYKHYHLIHFQAIDLHCMLKINFMLFSQYFKEALSIHATPEDSRYKLLYRLKP